MPSSRRSNVWILAGAALVLLVIAFVLSRATAEADAARVDAGPAAPNANDARPHAKVVYPRDLKARRAATAPPAPTPDQKPHLDAMQRALFAPDEKGALFIEANAIRHSPLVEKMLRCRQKGHGDGLNEMKEKLGIDPMEDIDRVGFDGDVVVASGFFSKMKVPPELGEGEAYGDGGRIWSASDDKGEEVFFGKQGDDLLLTGADEDQVKQALDRASGKTPTEAPDLPPGFGEGEVYGTVGAAFLKSMFAGENSPLAQNVLQLVTSSNVLMNVDEDAALSLDLQAVDDKAAGDLSDAVKGALAGLRAKAESEGNQEVASMLEQARVKAGEGGRFSLDVAVPGDTLLHALGCGPDGTPLTDSKADSTGPSAPAPSPR